eukprot:TRINITY_DN1706_c0_g1_i3.p1 TRINITY_DN1706_c0_g1~~TRINITY_DN1706_c0_g1_i3.p1  ORF type:complete len:726 (-),score=149.15 TRINITY_DN1706_c0_g1_i3:421-2598(-)
MDISGTSDPYCRIDVPGTAGTQSRKTKTKKKTLAPQWNETFEFDIEPNLTMFQIHLFDWDRFSSDDRMGVVRVYIEKLFEQGIDRWFPIEKEKTKDNVSGELRLKITVKHPSRKSTTNRSISSSIAEPELSRIIKSKDFDGADKYIQNHTTNVTLLNATDKDGYTPLHVACSMRDPDSSQYEKIVLSLLKIEGIKVDLRNADGNTALHYFCQNFQSPVDCSEAFFLFLTRGADVNAENNNKETPLFKAIFNSVIRLLLVEMLIENGADVNKFNIKGEGVLHYAVRLGREDLVSTLIKAGADISVRGQGEKKTPKELAIQSAMTHLVEIFKDVEELQDWLKARDLSQYALKFIKRDVFLGNLSLITEAMLKDFGLQPSARTKLLDEIKPMKKDDDDKDKMKPKAGVSELAAILEQLGLSETQKGPSDWILENTDIEFTRKLGSGTSGDVYKGLYKGKVVALKVLKEMTQDKEINEFKKEFSIMSAIRSPYVVYFFGICVKPKLCMVMEMCSRGSLYHVLKEGPPEDISWELAFHLAIQAVTGVNVLHTSNPQILHRDLKSLNLLVTDDWQVKVCDFGLSRFDVQENMETMCKMRGTMAFCAPEIYFGKKFTPQADVYSIGIILWELVYRVINQEYAQPYSEFSELRFDFQIIIKSAKQGVRPTIPPSTPPPVNEVITQCLHPEPSHRPDTGILLQALTKLHEDYKANPAQWDACIQPKRVEEASSE